jgi:drug/metabolite transporter (DMT)-like permease
MRASKAGRNTNQTATMQLLTYLSLVVTMFLWGGTFIAGRLLVGSVTPASAAFLRFFIASLTLTLLVLLMEKRLTRPAVKLWLPLFFLGLSGVFSYNVLFFSGLHYISAGRASLFIASTPLMITIFASIFFSEKLTPLKIAGVLFSLTGALLVISNGHPAALLSGGFGRGELALIGCVLSWSVYSLIGRSVLQHMTPLLSVCYSSIIGTLLLFIPAASGGLLRQLPAISVADWLSLCYLGIFGTAIGFSLYYRGIDKIGPTRAGIFINLVPLFALFLSWLILDESIKPMVLVGGALVLCGVSMTNYIKK